MRRPKRRVADATHCLQYCGWRKFCTSTRIAVAERHNQLGGVLERFLFLHILGIIIPTDFHIFQRGRSTTNQCCFRGAFRCCRILSIQLLFLQQRCNRPMYLRGARGLRFSPGLQVVRDSFHPPYNRINVYIYIYIYIYMYVFILQYIYIYIYICISCQKRKKVSQYIPMKFTCLPITSTKKHISIAI